MFHQLFFLFHQVLVPALTNSYVKHTRIEVLCIKRLKEKSTTKYETITPFLLFIIIDRLEHYLLGTAGER